MHEPRQVDDAPNCAGEVAGLCLSSLALGDCFYASPTSLQRSWAQDALTWRGCGSPAGLAEQFAAARAGGITQPVAFGAVPFDGAQEGFFVWPRHRVAVAHAGAAAVGWAQSAEAAADHGQLLGGHEVPDADGYRAAVRAALTRIAGGSLDKVVLARTLEVEMPAPLDYGRLMQTLCARNTKGYTFALPLADTRSTCGDVPMLVGASPELLVRRVGRRIHVNPLAGSIPRRTDDTTADAALAARLLRSDKDLREHAIVVREIARILGPFCAQLSVPSCPSVIGTDTLWHLSTQIDGVLTEPAPTALELACAMHPTPAICGFPTEPARAAIGELEDFERDYYAGLVGWQDEAGNGEWALALRCARVQGRCLRLYAGAGIVAGSDPQSEYIETQTKLATLFRALQSAG